MTIAFQLSVLIAFSALMFPSDFPYTGAKLASDFLHVIDCAIHVSVYLRDPSQNLPRGGEKSKHRYRWFPNWLFHPCRNFSVVGSHRRSDGGTGGKKSCPGPGLEIEVSRATSRGISRSAEQHHLRRGLRDDDFLNSSLATGPEFS